MKYAFQGSLRVADGNMPPTGFIRKDNPLPNNKENSWIR